MASLQTINIGPAILLLDVQPIEQKFIHHMLKWYNDRLITDYEGLYYWNKIGEISGGGGVSGGAVGNPRTYDLHHKVKIKDREQA